MRIRDWSSDVCSSDLNRAQVKATLYQMDYSNLQVTTIIGTSRVTDNAANARIRGLEVETEFIPVDGLTTALSYAYTDAKYRDYIDSSRSEEHTSELQSLMRISYAVFCLKKKTHHNRTNRNTHNIHYIQP